jgi:Uma2 family endonuclease
VFVSYSRLPRDADDNEYIQVAPELVFEVLSEDDRWPEVLDKIAEYLRSGIDNVCVLEPEIRTIYVYRRLGSPQILRHTDTLEFPDLLPGFRCLVADLFPPPRTPAS